jgi:outer membrane murein-binding lipoprotein Lpp
MSELKKSAAPLRLAVLIAIGGLSLTACATKKDIADQIAPISQRLDAVEARVQDASAKADAASTEARTATQRLDQLEGRVGELERRPARRPRG